MISRSRAELKIIQLGSDSSLTATATTPFIIILFLITGQSHGGLHFPRGTFSFQGRVAEINVKLQDEIAEWQKRMQEYLLEVHNLQQQQQQTAAAAAGSGSGGGPDLIPQPQVVAQNGAPQANNEDHQQNQHEEAGGEAAEQPRSSSQLRE